MSAPLVMIASEAAALAVGKIVDGRKPVGDHVLHESSLERDGWPLALFRVSPLASAGAERIRYRIVGEVAPTEFFGPGFPELDAFMHDLGERWVRPVVFTPETESKLRETFRRHHEALAAVRPIPPMRVRILHSWQAFADSRKLMRSDTPYERSLRAALERHPRSSALHVPAWRAQRLAIYRTAHALMERVFRIAVSDFAGGFMPMPGNSSASAIVARKADLVRSTLPSLAPYIAKDVINGTVELEGTMSGDEMVSDATARDGTLAWLVEMAQTLAPPSPQDAHLLAVGTAVAFASCWSTYLPLQILAANVAGAIVFGASAVRELYAPLLEMAEMGIVPLGATKDNEFRVFVLGPEA